MTAQMQTHTLARILIAGGALAALCGTVFLGMRWLEYRRPPVVQTGTVGHDAAFAGKRPEVLIQTAAGTSHDAQARDAEEGAASDRDPNEEISPPSEQVQSELDAIRAQRVAWFLARLNQGGFSRGDLRYGAGWLRTCLEDPAARAAFERWFLANPDSGPVDEKSRQAVLTSLCAADPALFMRIAGLAIDSAAWPLAAAALDEAIISGSPPGEFLDADRFMSMASPAVASGCPEAQYAAVRAGAFLGKHMRTLSAEQTRDLLIGLCEQPVTDAAVLGRAAEMLRSLGLLDPERDAVLFDRIAFGQGYAEERATALGIALSTRLGMIEKAPASDTAYQLALEMQDAMLRAMQDPDPIMRHAAARCYNSHVVLLREVQESLRR